MQRHRALLLGALTAAALSACTMSPLADTGAADARVASVADAIASPGATQSTGAPAGSSSARYLSGAPVQVALGATTTVSGPGVAVDGTTVTITAAGAYRLTGTVADGRVVVQAADDAAVTLILDGARISSSTGAPLAVLSDTDLTLVLADGSENVLSDAASYALPAGADEPDGALFAKGDLTIAGDGLDANGSISMTGGTVIVDGAPVNMESAIDYDGAFKVTGGTLIAAGSAGMAQAPGATSTQNSVRVTFPAVQPPGTLVSIAGPDGRNVLTFAPPKAFQSLVLSSPDLASGASYRVSTGGSAAGTAVDGLYAAGTASAGAEFASFTVSGPVTTVGTAGAPGVARRR